LIFTSFDEQFLLILVFDLFLQKSGFLFLSLSNIEFGSTLAGRLRPLNL